MRIQVKDVSRWVRGLAAVVAISALLYGCASVTTEMTAGERLYRAKCASCHRLIGPAEHETSAWRHYVDEYGSNLRDDQKRAILEFLAGGE